MSARITGTGHTRVAYDAQASSTGDAAPGFNIRPVAAVANRNQARVGFRSVIDDPNVDTNPNADLEDQAATMAADHEHKRVVIQAAATAPGVVTATYVGNAKPVNLQSNFRRVSPSVNTKPVRARTNYLRIQTKG